MDPMPPGTVDQKWTMYAFDANEAGMGVFTRDGLALAGHWNEDFKAMFIQSKPNGVHLLREKPLARIAADQASL